MSITSITPTDSFEGRDRKRSANARRLSIERRVARQNKYAIPMGA